MAVYRKSKVECAFLSRDMIGSVFITNQWTALIKNNISRDIKESCRWVMEFSIIAWILIDFEAILVNIFKYEVCMIQGTNDKRYRMHNK